MNLLDGFIKEKIRNRKPAIWGIGNNSTFGRDILKRLGISKWTWIDKKGLIGKDFENMKMITPEEVSSEYYILISTMYIDTIRRHLSGLGLNEWSDWIYACEPEYYEGLLQNPNADLVPDLTWNDLEYIEDCLKEYNDVVPIDVEWNKFDKFEKNLNFFQTYRKSDNKRYKRKIMEYYFVNKILDFETWNHDDIYIDIGAAGSPFTKYLRERGIKAYAVDVQPQNMDCDYYITEDATQMSFGDMSVRGSSIQSAFEMFPYGKDIALIKEMGRVLIKGGKIVISPLYLHKEYISAVSPNYYGMGFADPNSRECIRTDCWGQVPLSRFYDPDTFYSRIVKNAERFGFRIRIYSLRNAIVEKDKFVYLKFILELDKV